MIKKVVIILSILIGIVLISGAVLYNYLLSPVNKNSNEMIEITIKTGESSNEIAKDLKNNKLIKNDQFFIIYLKLNKINDLKASTYKLKQSMSMKEIIDIISGGKGYNPNEITITFKEGKNIRSIAQVIDKNTDNSYDDVMNKLNDEKYIDSLIEKYWFLTKEIKNKELFYPIEGYLFPDTYNFNNKKVTVEEIFEVLLNQTDKILTKYKDKINAQDFTVHEVMTFASIIELEGLKKKDKPDIASVFYNRLAIDMSLGSDVTACYAQKIDDTAKCHNTANFNYDSPYNTRPLSNKGLPVGPIANPGIDSIDAVLNPTKTDYIYFVADKHTNIYFFKTYGEFETKINELKENGDWL